VLTPSAKPNCTHRRLEQLIIIIFTSIIEHSNRVASCAAFRICSFPSYKWLPPQIPSTFTSATNHSSHGDIVTPDSSSPRSPLGERVTTCAPVTTAPATSLPRNPHTRPSNRNNRPRPRTLHSAMRRTYKPDKEVSSRLDFFVLPESNHQHSFLEAMCFTLRPRKLIFHDYLLSPPKSSRDDTSFDR
jgi:hypothetical protein